MKSKILLIVTLILSATLYAETVVVHGFNFEGGDFSKGIETKKVKPLYNDKKNTKNQVVVGQSQGGLTSIGYAQMMRKNRNSNVKAVITVDSPIVGFAGLDYGYPQLRSRLLSAVRVHDRGVSAALAIISSKLTFFLDLFPTTAKGNLLLGLAGEVPMKPLFLKALNKSKADASMSEITDMGRMSSYVKNNVRETRISKRRKISHYRTSVQIRWRKGWFGVRYPVVVRVRTPVYKYYNHYYIASNAHRNISKIGHIIGTDNDPLRMTGSEEANIRKIVNGVEIGYNVAGGILAVKYAIFPWKWYLSKRCFSAASWTKNYKSEWGRIIGGTSNDGFITTGSQSIPGRPTSSYKIDHVRSVPPGLQANKKDFVKSADGRTNVIYYGSNSHVAKMKRRLGVGGL